MGSVRIGVIASIAHRLPPASYGPWEQIASTLTEGFVARGHEVTLFATADSATTATLVGTAPAGYEDELLRVTREAAAGMPVRVVTGGGSRSESVSIALAATGDEVIAVHDAARPLVEPELVDRCVERLLHWGCDGVVAAARAVDAVKEADSGGRVARLIR